MLSKWVLAAALLAVVSVPARAAVVVTGIGPRVGFSVSPDQIVFGGHAVIGDIAPSVTFDPNLEIGLGDNLTTIGLNFDIHYHFTLTESDWRPYAGAGVAVNFIEVDREPPASDDSETGVGGELILGAGVPTKSGNRFFGEMKIGLGDEVADLKLIVGWNFKM